MVLHSQASEIGCEMQCRTGRVVARASVHDSSQFQVELSMRLSHLFDHELTGGIPLSWVFQRTSCQISFPSPQMECLMPSVRPGDVAASLLSPLRNMQFVQVSKFKALSRVECATCQPGFFGDVSGMTPCSITQQTT